MALNYRHNQANLVTSSAVSVSPSTTPLAGSLLIVSATERDGASSGAITGYGGSWTLFGEISRAPTDSTFRQYGASWWKVADGTESGSITVTWNAGAGRTVISYLEIAPTASETFTFEAEGSNDTGAAAGSQLTVSTPSITTTDNLILGVCYIKDSSGITTSLTNPAWTNIALTGRAFFNDTANHGVDLQRASTQDTVSGVKTSTCTINISSGRGFGVGLGVFSLGGAAGVTGTVTETEADDTLAASGTFTETFTGTVAESEDADTLAASGTFTETFTGTVAESEDADTLAASGHLSYSGSVAETDADDTLAASGHLTYTGSLAETEADDTVAASGTATAPQFSGSLAETQADDTLAASGSYTGTFARVSQVYIEAPAGLVIVGSVDETQAGQTVAASGTFEAGDVTGSLAETEADDTLAADGHLVHTGSVSETEADDTLTASGAFTAAEFTGSLGGTPVFQANVFQASVFQIGDAVIQDDQTLAASGTFTLGEITGTVNVTQGNQTAAAQGFTEISFDHSTFVDTDRPDRWLATARARPFDETARPTPGLDDTARPDRWIGTSRTLVFDETARPDRWIGTSRTLPFDLTVRPAHFSETVFVREGVTVALTEVDLGPYTLNEVPEPLVIRVMRTHRDNSTTGMPLHGQTPAWTAKVYIVAPDNTTVVDGRACEILDPSTLETEYPAAGDQMTNGDAGWIRMAWATGDLAQLSGVGDYSVQVTLDNGVLLLKSTDVWVPEVNSGPAEDALLGV